MKLRRSTRNLRASSGGPSEASAHTSTRSYSHNPAPTREAIPAASRAALGEASTVFGQPPAFPVKQPITSDDPVTPKRSDAATVPVPEVNFTPGTGVEMHWSYMLEDFRDRTRKNVYEGNRQRAEGHVVTDVPVDIWLAECAAPLEELEPHSPEYWEAISLGLFTEKEVPSVCGEAKFVRRTFSYADER